MLRGLVTHTWQLPGVVLRLWGNALLILAKYAARGFKPRFPEWTLVGELFQGTMRYVQRNYVERMCQPRNAAYLRDTMFSFGKRTSAATARPLGACVQYFRYNGLEHLWVRSLNHHAHTGKRFVVLYFHGGGFVIGSPTSNVEMTSRLLATIHKDLTQRLGVDVAVEFLLANYRKAPQFQYPVPPQDAYAMYKYLVVEEKLEPSQIILMGDSAGAALCMTTMLRARDEDPALVPAAGVLLCPFVDRLIKEDDATTPHCILTSNCVETFWTSYIPATLDQDASTRGDASPAQCNLQGLPPVYIQAAGHDHVVNHSKSLHTKALADGLTSWTLDIVPRMPHVFMITPSRMFPTAGLSLTKISDYCVDQFARKFLQGTVAA